MAWVYLDDQFADHPKVVAAGDAAAWLYVCGLAYCKRYDTGGIIPKAQVPKLTSARAVGKLTNALLAAPPGYDAGLWEDCGDHYRVHDYEAWNKPQKSRSEAGRKAAKARWEREARTAPPDPPSDASDSDANRNANASANASANAWPDAMPQDAHHPIPIPTDVLKSSSNSHSRDPDPDDDDQDTPRDTTARVETALAILARSDLDKRQQTSHLKPLGDAAAWELSALTRRRQRHANYLTALADGQPDLTPADLAKHVDPTPDTPTPRRPEIAALEATQSAHLAKARANTAAHRQALAEPWEPPPPPDFAALRHAVQHPGADHE